MEEHHTKETWVLTVTILASSMAFIDGSALNVALPVIQSGLHASGSQLLWVANAYLVALAALILTGGSLGDRFGRKRVLAVGIALFTAASLACGLAPTIGFLIAARAVQGMGGALMIPGSLALLSAGVAPERRGRAIGTWSAATTLVTVVGPALGGALSDLGLWRAVFLINLPLGISALVLLATKVVEEEAIKRESRIDFPGSFLAAIALAGLTYGFIEAPRFGFGDARIAAALAVGVAASLVFVLVERSSASPMLPLSLFKSRAFSGANVLTLLLYGALSAATFFLALNLVQVQGYSKTQSGLALMPFAIALTLLSRWAGALADRRGPRGLLVVGPALTGMGFLAMSLAGITAGPQAYWAKFFPGILLFGIGMGLTVAPLTSTVMGALEPRFSGTASGVNNAVARGASALAIAILGSAALFSFTLSISATAKELDGQSRGALMSEAQELGAALPPPGLSEQKKAEVRRAIAQSFASAFRLVLVACAALAFASSLSAALILEARAPRPGLRPPIPRTVHRR